LFVAIALAIKQLKLVGYTYIFPEMPSNLTLLRFFLSEGKVGEVGGGWRRLGRLEEVGKVGGIWRK
jgi:hypothetical protein